MKGTKLRICRKKCKILTDKNQNEYLKQDNQSEGPPSTMVYREIQVMTFNENKLKDFGMEASSVVTSKSRIKASQLENENLNLKKSPIEYSHLKTRDADDFVLFRRKEKSQPPGEDYFNRLSDEILLHIFQMLPKSVLVKCSSVCRRWQELSCDETLWKRYDFGRKVVKPGTLEILLKRRISVLRLAMAEVKHPVFSDCYLQGVLWRSNLQYLDLSMAIIKTEDLADLLSKCCSLKKLSVEHLILDDHCCTNIAENDKLEVLNMAMCSGITPSGLRSITICCKNLKEWNLGWAKYNEDCVEACFDHFPTSLKRLNLSGNKNVILNDALIRVARRCRHLRELDISDNIKLSNVSIEVVIQQCPNLQHLHTSRSYNIPTETNKLLRGMKNFKNLEIFQTLTDTALATLREFMPEIKINQHMFSTIARPTVGIRRTSIWEIPTRDRYQ